MSRKACLAMCTVCAALLVAAFAQAQEKLELFSWWTGDDDAGLRALVQEYNSQYPDVTVTNATATVGADATARAVLRTRMLVGDPPDTFQTHGGRNFLDTWVIANRIEDLSGFYKTQGWSVAFPHDLIALLSTKAGVWSVPLAVNRSNVLWYIPTRISAWGALPPRTMEGLFAECRKLKEEGVTAPISVGNMSTLIHLWESIAVATLGPDDWSALWTGRLKFTDPRAERVWDNYGKALEFANTDGADLSWQQALDRVVKGESAFIYMGDWMERYLTVTLKLTPGEGFAWVPAPGTNGIFIARTDSFCLPRGAKDKASVFKWFMLLGTKEAQDLFNPANGSISPRKDSDAEKYDLYFQSAIKDWRESRIVGSMAQGVTAPQLFVSQFADVLGIYASTRDAQAASNAAQAIADQTRL